MIFFKAEANSKIGGGHLYRSLSIARECNRAGEKCEFIFAESSELAIQRTIDEGFNVNIIEENEKFNINEYLRIIPQNSIIIFDTDDYRFYSGKLVELLRFNKIKTACFTITDQFQVSTDLLINPNIISKIHNYKCTNHTKKLIGPEYFILHEDFRDIKNIKPKRIKTPFTLLLIFGNADICHLTILFLEIIPKLSSYLEKVIIVAGQLNSDLENIKNTINTISEVEVELHINTNKIFDLYKKSDLAVTSAGMAMWEIALFCIPQLVIASSQRELNYTDYLSDIGYIIKLGDYSDLPSVKELMLKLKDIFLFEKYNSIKTVDFCESINPKGIQLIVEYLVKQGKIFLKN